VPQLLKLADVFALVSLHEGFGISAVEAVAAGCRVVYSDVAGLSELMQGVGWPCSPGDATSIAAALLQALEAQPCAKRDVQGLELTRRFELRAMIDSYRQIYGGVRAPTS
jgi:glycosyltransferase involved in cell wall biosynthesis